MTTLNQPAELTYTVRGGDGKEYGPVTFEQITAWTRDGRIQVQSELRRSDMQHWAKAGEFTELKPNCPNIQPTVLTGSSGATFDSTNDPATLAQLKSGASWFYWIAGVSLINSIVAFTGNSWHFIFGLGITQILDGFGSELGTGGKSIVLLLDLMVAGLFVFFGVFANKRHQWAFIVGMLLFALDGAFFVIFQDWIGVAFHIFALYCLFRGVKACRELRA
jgi:hypothetical protein